MTLPESLAHAAAWPFEEARKLLARVERTGQKQVVFETGYGPSGLPHIGTFAEVARTSMVRHAFHALTDGAVPTRLIAFSDDMDGLRGVPDNVPRQDMLRGHLDLPLSSVPDPFGTHESFAHHNNARLRAFLDRFGFDYEFLSATECYRAGRFDAALLRLLARYDEVMAVMLPSLGEERRATYSPFLPLHPRTGRVMQVPVDAVDPGAGTIAWRDPETGERFETPVTGGRAKLQWKPDWAMRWTALGVDYEMAGKDLIDSVRLSGRIARILGAEPPEGFNYELFLDQFGRKISKSRGNGLTIDEWLAYAPAESLALFMFGKPREAKRLHFDVIPRAVDDYLSHLERFPAQPEAARLTNPAWHIHAGAPPAPEPVTGPSGSVGMLSYTMLLNLAAVANSEDPQVLWGFIRNYAPDASPATHPILDRMVGHAVRYFHDFVRPEKSYREPTETERTALAELRDALAPHVGSTDQEGLQAVVYDVGRRHFPDPRTKGPDGRPGVSHAWFAAIYQVLLGEPRGPRFGSFVALNGVARSLDLIQAGLDGGLAREHGAFLAARAGIAAAS